jgi:hypothetical protein
MLDKATWWVSIAATDKKRHVWRDGRPEESIIVFLT